MKIFTKLFLAAALFVPAVAGAETIPAISYNPSRLGWFRNLKVVTSLTFDQRLQVGTLNIGNNLSTITLGPTATATEISIARIQPFDDRSSGQTVNFSHGTLENRASVNINQGRFTATSAENITINNEGADGRLPTYAKVATPKQKDGETTTLRVIGDSQGSHVGRISPDDPNKARSSVQTITGLQLGPNVIPVPKIDCGKKNPAFKWATIKNTDTQVLAIHCQ